MIFNLSGGGTPEYKVETGLIQKNGTNPTSVTITTQLKIINAVLIRADDWSNAACILEVSKGISNKTNFTNGYIAYAVGGGSPQSAQANLNNGKLTINTSGTPFDLQYNYNYVLIGN